MALPPASRSTHPTALPMTNIFENGRCFSLHVRKRKISFSFFYSMALQLRHLQLSFSPHPCYSWHCRYLGTFVRTGDAFGSTRGVSQKAAEGQLSGALPEGERIIPVELPSPFFLPYTKRSFCNIALKVHQLSPFRYCLLFLAHSSSPYFNSQLP